MNDNVICRGEFEAARRSIKHSSKLLIASVIVGLICVVMWRACVNSYDYFWRHRDVEEIMEIVFLITLILGIVLFGVSLSCFCFLFINKFIASRCTLTLEEGQIKGQLKTLFGKKSLQLPLDHLDNVMVFHRLMDKLRGGKTLLISFNRGLIKFHYVQNANEFAQVAMEKIEEVKKKTFHNPALAPTAAAAQPTGNDTMEKLDSLKKMLENGLITQEEFDTKRKELLEKL